MRHKLIKESVELIEKLKRNLDQMSDAQKKQYAEVIENTLDEIKWLMGGANFSYFAPVICSLRDTDEQRKEHYEMIVKAQAKEWKKIDGLIEESLAEGNAEGILGIWENQMLIKREDLLAKITDY